MKKAASKRAARTKPQPVLKIPTPAELTTTETEVERWGHEEREKYRIAEQEAEWHRVTEVLQANGRFMEIDRRGLIQLCKLFGFMRLAEREIAIDGMTTIQHTGFGDNIVPHPMNANYRALAKEYRSLLKAFGMLPDGRMKPKPTSLPGGKKTGDKTLSLKELNELVRQNMKRPLPGSAATKTAAKKRAK
jgi:P27 family predicted phage terminase small subunit